jgi:hypothetical protein
VGARPGVEVDEHVPGPHVDVDRTGALPGDQHRRGAVVVAGAIDAGVSDAGALDQHGAAGDIGYERPAAGKVVLGAHQVPGPGEDALLLQCVPRRRPVGLGRQQPTGRGGGGRHGAPMASSRWD